MPDTTYRLSGFAGGIDWRPINFKQRLQTTRVCRLCGVVPHSIAVLPCTHFLCQSCLDGCADGGRSACPLDKMSFEADADVSWISFPQKHMERLQVGCWNAQHGCGYVGPAGELLDHFENNCSFHAASCPRCQDVVLVRDMPRHYGAGCGGVAALPETHRDAASAVPTTAALDAAACGCHDMLTSIQGRVNDLSEALGRLGARLPEDTPVVGGRQTRSHETKLQKGPSSSCPGASAQQSTEINALLSVLEEVKFAVTEGFSNGEQGTRRDVAGPSTQSRQPPVATIQRVPAPLPSRTASGSNTQGVLHNGENGVELVVFSLLYKPWGSDLASKDLKAVWHQLFVAGEDTGVCIRCVVLKNSTFVPIYAMSTQPARWKLPDIRPLSPQDLSSPDLREWVTEKAKEPGREYLPVSAYAPDLRLRCLVDVTSQGIKKTPSGEVQLDLLIRLERRFLS
ncbi:uncharacterized protein LOC144107096 isoform X1 [Amblyomma americanum]